jgi:hypothetical protein
VPLLPAGESKHRWRFASTDSVQPSRLSCRHHKL